MSDERNGPEETFHDIERKLRARIEKLEAQVEQFRETNRRMNRRVQLLEGWWQRKVERANYWRSLTMTMWRRDKENIAPDMKAIEEVAYQRGYEDGYDAKFYMPRRAPIIRAKKKGADHE